MAGREGQLTRPGCLHSSLGGGRSYVAVALMSGRRYVGRPYVSRPYGGRPYVGRPIVLVPLETFIHLRIAREQFLVENQL